MRELLRVDDKDWERLPKDLVGYPVYYRIDGDGKYEVWPKPADHIIDCKIMVQP